VKSDDDRRDAVARALEVIRKTGGPRAALLERGLIALAGADQAPLVWLEGVALEVLEASRDELQPQRMELLELGATLALVVLLRLRQDDSGS
jgi:hypothetical protein